MTRRIVAVSLGWLGISMISDAVPALLLPHQLLVRGQADATSLGLITLIAIALAAAIQPLAGRWSDSVGRWPVISVGVAVAVLGLGLMLAPETAVAGAVVSLLGVSVAQAGHQPLLPQLVPTQLRGRAAGVKSALDVAGATIGFLLLAALLGSGASIAAIVLLASLLAVPFVIAYAILPRTGTEPSGASRGIRDAYRLGATIPRGLLALVFARFLFLLGIFAVGRFLLLFVAQRSGLDAHAAAEQAGSALAVLALITVAASVPSGWLADRFGRRALMLAGGFVAGIGIGLVPVAGSIELVLAVGALLALGSAAFNAASWAALTDLTASRDAGRLLGLANVGTAGAAAAAGAFGLLIDAGNAGGASNGYLFAFEVAAVCTMAGGMLAWRTGVTRHPTRSLVHSEVPQ